jgi:hypothetical protein
MCGVLPAYVFTLKTKVRCEIVLNLSHTLMVFPVSEILIFKPSENDVHCTTFLLVIRTVRQTFRSSEVCIKTSAKNDEVINGNVNIAA